MILIGNSNLQTQLATKDNEHRKQIAQLQSQQTSREGDFQKQLTQARKAAEAEAERVQRRKEAETADLKATISRLEVDLMKVRDGWYGIIRQLLTKDNT